MSFTAELFRKMPPSQYGEFATCPFTGLSIPKRLEANLAWRKDLVRKSASSAAVRRALKAASSSSPIFWLNAFGWTFLQKKVSETGKEVGVQGGASHVPFITWKVQDQAILELLNAIRDGHDALMHKARDMGFTWIVIGLFQWHFQFRPSTTFLELSRKEVLVDSKGDMDSLFEKHRYLMRWQPEWLRPQRLVDNTMHLENKDIGTAIMGESTNENAGQGSRKTAIFLDEFARVRDGAEIDLATADTSTCRIFNSTPQGPLTHFTRLYRDFSEGKRLGKLILGPWWMHPAKGKDAKIVATPDGEEVTSPWREIEKARRSKRNVAQNIDGEHGKSGDAFFDYDEIERHRKLHQSDPVLVGDIKLLADDVSDADKQDIIRKRNVGAMVFVPNGGKRAWRFWVPLVDGRPIQSTRYVFGVDISNGSGASNSVVTVLDHRTNMVVAKYWDAFTSPEDLAEVVAFAGIWFGGKAPPLVIFEKNGPGVIFGRKLKEKLGYPNIYYQEVLDAKSKQKTVKWGWHSSDAKKEILLGEYREALKNNTIVNPCREALDEARDYVYDDNGKIEPGTLGVEEGGGQALHGDHVIADALVVRGRASLPAAEKDVPARAPAGTPGWRKEQARRRRTMDAAWAG